MVGESGVGKTCIMDRYLNNDFLPKDYTKYSSVAFHNWYSENGRYIIKQIIWDTAGQETYRSLASFYYKEEDSVILVYDTTGMTGFLEVNYWVKQILQNSKDDILISIVGNKCDLVDDIIVDEDKGRKFAEEHNADFFLVSAKENVNITTVYTNLALRKFPIILNKTDCDQHDSSQGLFTTKADISDQKKTKLKCNNKKIVKCC